jgi:hypothetical protein
VSKRNGKVDGRRFNRAITVVVCTSDSVVAVDYGIDTIEAAATSEGIVLFIQRDSSCCCCVVGSGAAVTLMDHSRRCDGSTTTAPLTIVAYRKRWTAGQRSTFPTAETIDPSGQEEFSCQGLTLDTTAYLKGWLRHGMPRHNSLSNQSIGRFAAGEKASVQRWYITATAAQQQNVLLSLLLVLVSVIQNMRRIQVCCNQPWSIDEKTLLRRSKSCFQSELGKM